MNFLLRKNLTLSATGERLKINQVVEQMIFPLHSSGVATTHVEIVWDPPWTQDMMAEAAREQFAQMGMLY